MSASTRTDLHQKVVQLFQDREANLPETPLGSIDGQADARPVSNGAAIDLTGVHRVISTYGPGGAGKSTLLRWMADRAYVREGGDPFALASIDVHRQTLRLFHPETNMPPPGMAPMAFVEGLLQGSMARKTNIAIDFPADATIEPLLRQIPDLYAKMRDKGTEAVSLFVLTPRDSDLTVLSRLEAAGFHPPATALILNLGKTVSNEDGAWVEFNHIRRHSAYKAALDRGAIEIWMPRLFCAERVERRHIRFSQAVTNEGLDPDRQIDFLDQSRVSSWLTYMETAFAPVASWLL